MIALGHDRGLALGEHAGLGRPDAGHVADRVHAGERRLERQRVDRDPAVDGHPRLLARPSGHAVHRDAEEQVVAAARSPSRAPRPCASGSSDAHEPLGVPLDARARRRRRAAPPTRRATAGSGAPSGITSAISRVLAQPALDEEVVHQQRRLARRRRALERRRGHPDDHPAAGEVGEHVAQPRTRRPPCRTRGPPSTSPGVAAGSRSAPSATTMMSASKRPGVGLDPLRAAGSIDRIVACTNCTPGLTMSA